MRADREFQAVSNLIDKRKWELIKEIRDPKSYLDEIEYQIESRIDDLKSTQESISLTLEVVSKI